MRIIHNLQDCHPDLPVEPFSPHGDLILFGMRDNMKGDGKRRHASIRWDVERIWPIREKGEAN
jgi:hypothetical protein